MTDKQIKDLMRDAICWGADNYFSDENWDDQVSEFAARADVFIAAAVAAEREANRTALNVAKGALLMCTPCAAPDCALEQREWLDDAMRCIDRQLAGLPDPRQPPTGEPE